MSFPDAGIFFFYHPWGLRSLKVLSSSVWLRCGRLSWWSRTETVGMTLGQKGSSEHPHLWLQWIKLEGETTERELYKAK